MIRLRLEPTCRLTLLGETRARAHARMLNTHTRVLVRSRAAVFCNKFNAPGEGAAMRQQATPSPEGKKHRLRDDVMTIYFSLY